MGRLHRNIIFFDFDGTIGDSAPGISDCFRRTLDELGLPIPDQDTLRSFVGPPLSETFELRFGLTGKAQDDAIGLFRKNYPVYGLNRNEMFSGVREMLEVLRDRGCILAIATSKPEVHVRRIIADFRISHLFEYIAGSTMDKSRTQKSEVIEYALESLGSPDRGRVLMVGDRFYDVEGAHKCGLACMGVTYGYGSREELMEAGADYLADTPAQVAEFILGN